jgi:RNA ligase
VTSEKQTSEQVAQSDYPQLHIGELFDLEAHAAHVAAGYVKVRQHPTLPLEIHNYAEKAAYERVWDAVTQQCRGLIVNAKTGMVVARPWPKFFNYGERDVEFDLTAPVEVTDKHDGSLGILVRMPLEGPLIATRGSFTSDQALHATDLYIDRYAGRWTPQEGLTYLFEIVYPANRIVLDYGDTDDLILLGAVHIASGATYGPAALPEWRGRRTKVFAHRTLAEALEAPPRKNAEGVVVRFPATGTLVKLKQADYVTLHRIVTGLNARVVWEKCAEPGGLPALLEALPNEFQDWAIDLAADLNAQATEIEHQAVKEYASILRDLGGQDWGRKEYAEKAVRSPHRALLFLLLDGRPIRDHVWKTLRPSGDMVPRVFGEDTA